MKLFLFYDIFFTMNVIPYSLNVLYTNELTPIKLNLLMQLLTVTGLFAGQHNTYTQLLDQLC